MASSDTSYFDNQQRLSNLISRISLWARKKMFRQMVDHYRPTHKTKVLDVGVTSNQRADSNFFEKLYPYTFNLTAFGLDDASFLEDIYPGLSFVQGDGESLPFSDNEFDLVVSFAVLEHVGNYENQKKFVNELLRVGRTVCLTTPNRWYPIEFHTVLPLVHWLPRQYFRFILNLFGHQFYSQEENLNLLGEQEIRDLFPNPVHTKVFRFRLLGLTSNFMLFYSQ